LLGQISIKDFFEGMTRAFVVKSNFITTEEIAQAISTHRFKLAGILVHCMLVEDAPATYRGRHLREVISP